MIPANFECKLTKMVVINAGVILFFVSYICKFWIRSRDRISVQLVIQVHASRLRSHEVKDLMIYEWTVHVWDRLKQSVVKSRHSTSAIPEEKRSRGIYLLCMLFKLFNQMTPSQLVTKLLVSSGGQ